MELTKWNEARTAIEKCKSFDEVKNIRDKMEALRQYAKQAGESLEMQNNISEIKLRAERRAGEMLKESEITSGRPKNNGDTMSPFRLCDIGIHKKQSSRWQRIASIPEPLFEDKIFEIKDKNIELTQAELLKLYNSLEKEKQRAERIFNQESVINSIPEIEVREQIKDLEKGWHKIGNQYLYHGNNTDKEFLDNLPQSKLAFADPPYNAGVDKWDTDFIWQQDYLQNFADVVAVTPGGWNACEFYRQTKMNYIWEMACWISNGMTHGRCGYANWIKISIFSKSKVRFSQDFFKITIKTSETIDTSHKGRKPYDFMYHLINEFTEEQDFIIDPFAGSGTTLIMSEKMNRISYNAELDKQYCIDIISRMLHDGAEYEQL